jgi:hypothetical protein
MCHFSLGRRGDRGDRAQKFLHAIAHAVDAGGGFQNRLTIDGFPNPMSGENMRTLRSLLRPAFIVLLILLLNPMVPVAHAAPAMTHYDTKYYDLYTDIDADAAREAGLRMTRMAEEYYARTRAFAGVITHKFPFYLYTRSEDYYAAGGLPGSAGLFVSSGNGNGKLMAIAGKETGNGTWHVVQHEGFHQFAAAVIGGSFPPWMNEGLAEYFGESIFTGDGFVTGVIPPYRLQRLKDEINDGKLKPIPAMMSLSGQEWTKNLSIENYDQAWSMVYFLVQGNDGKYQKPFVAFMQQVSHGQQWERAWLATMGDASQFEVNWKKYWLGLPESPTAALYAQAETAIFTSYLARATDQQQTFADFDAFKSAAGAPDGLKIAADEWLPHSLLEGALRSADVKGSFSIAVSKQSKLPTMVDTLPDGTCIIGSFVLRNKKVASVDAAVDSLPLILAQAQKLAADKKKSEAISLLRNGIRQFPNSPALHDAQQALAHLQ